MEVNVAKTGEKNYRRKRPIYHGIARLGGWKNTKRTSRASIKTLWQGWFRLQTILEVYELAKYLD